MCRVIAGRRPTMSKRIAVFAALAAVVALAAAAFARWEITNLAGEPLSGRSEPMAVTAWTQ